MIISNAEYARLRREWEEEETRSCPISRRGCCQLIDALVKSSFFVLGIYAIAFAFRPPDHFGKIDWRLRHSLALGGAGLIAYSTRGVASACFRHIQDCWQLVTTPATLPDD